MSDAPARPITQSRASPASRWILRGDHATLADAIALPPGPCRSVRANDIAALWLGPDEWLLIDESDTAAGNRLASLTAALAGRAHSLVDISDRQLGITVSGPAAADALAMFVPLDLADVAFPVGMAARTVFEKSEIVLWRRDVDLWQLEVWRSFAPYVTTLLGHAQAELLAPT